MHSRLAAIWNGLALGAILILYPPLCDAKSDPQTNSLPEGVQRVIASIHDSTSTHDLNRSIIGSGFLFSTNEWVYLVTARHVLENRDGSLRAFVRCRFHPMGDFSEIPELLEVNLQTSSRAKNLILPKRDISAIRIGKIPAGKWIAAEGAKPLGPISPSVGFLGAKSQGREMKVVSVDQTTNFSEVRVTQEVFYFGFPVSINQHLTDSHYNPDFPLFRKGIVAGKDFERKLLVLDGFVHPGNSGGPVYITDQPNIGEFSFRLTGIITKSLPFVSVSKDENDTPTGVNIQNSGYAIVEPIDAILESLGDEIR